MISAEQLASPRRACGGNLFGDLLFVRRPRRISSAESSSASGVVLECMNPPVSVMIVVRMQVAMSRRSRHVQPAQQMHDDRARSSTRSRARS